MQGDEQSYRDGEGDSQAEFDIRPVLAFLRRRKLMILLVGLPLLIPATLYPFFQPPYYEAVATVAIERQAPVLEFGPDVLDESSRQGTSARAEESIVTLATSDAVLGALLGDGPDAQTPIKRSLKDLAKIRLGLAEDIVPTPEQQRQLQLEALRRSVTVVLGGGGDYMLVIATGSTGAAAASLANSLAESYVSHLAKQREAASQRAVTWLNQQIYELRDQTARKEQALTDLVAQGLNLRAFSDEEERGDDSLADLDTQIKTTRMELLATKQRLAEIAPGSAAGGDPGERANRARLQEQYAAASTSLESARLRFTPTHPEVRRLEEIVRTLGAKLGSSASRSAPLSPSELTERDELARDRARLEARLSVLQSSQAEQLAAGQKSEQYSRYRRLESELTIDRGMLEVLLTRRNETMLAAATKHTGAYVLDAAVEPLWAAGPNRKKLLLMGWVAAIGAGFAVALLAELLDRRVRDPDRIARILGTQTLAVMPVLRGGKVIPERQGSLGPGSIGAEGYRALRTGLAFMMRTRKIHSLLVASALAGEGKTTTSANLAAVFARMGKRVVLVDADLRRPRIHRVFKLARAPGVVEILARQARAVDAIVRPDEVGFDVLPAGTQPENPTELLASLEWSELMADLKREYDLVILDSPVLLAVPDALLLSADADGLLLVHKPGSLERRGLHRLRADLKSSGARLLGIVFNQIDPTNTEAYPSYLESPYVREGEKKRAFWKR